MPLDCCFDRKARLVEAEAAAHIAHRGLRRFEKAPPGRKLIIDLVVMDEREFAKRGLGSQAQILEQRRRANRIYPFLHQIINLATGMVVGGADCNVERAVAEVALAGDGAQTQLNVRGACEKPLELGHQPERGHRGRRCDRQLTLPASSVEREQRRFQFVEALGKFLKRVRGRRREDQLPAFALEQGCMQELLKRPDLMADGRWRHAKFDRGAREAQVSSCGLERAQGIQRDVCSHATTPAWFPPSSIQGVSRLLFRSARARNVPMNELKVSIDASGR
ncbi:MAG: hypothetical protein WCB02_19170, partial [Bradyrhizobium sp.]